MQVKAKQKWVGTTGQSPTCCSTVSELERLVKPLHVVQQSVSWNDWSKPYMLFNSQWVGTTGQSPTCCSTVSYHTTEVSQIVEIKRANDKLHKNDLNWCNQWCNYRRQRRQSPSGATRKGVPRTDGKGFFILCNYQIIATRWLKCTKIDVDAFKGTNF